MSEKKEIEKTETRASASIYEALVNARKGFKAVKKDAVNSFFKKKYASLGAIIEAVEDSLLENGLWFRFEEDAIDLNKTVNGGIITAINIIIYNGEGEEIVAIPSSRSIISIRHHTLIHTVPFCRNPFKQVNYFNGSRNL